MRISLMIALLAAACPGFAHSGSDTSTADAHGKPVTVVVLNWKRAVQLKTKVLPQLANLSLVNEVLVSHGRADTAFETPDLPSVRHFHHYHENTEYGLLLRFLTAKEASTKCVLFTDDDVALTEELVQTLYVNWNVHPYLVHGVVGRDLQADPFGQDKYEDTTKDILMATTRHAIDVVTGSDVRHSDPSHRQNVTSLTSEPYVEVPMVLTASAMTHVDVAQHAMEQSGVFDAFIKDSHSTPLWNGEDILLGVASAHFNHERGAPSSETFPRAYYELLWHVQFLPTGEAISDHSNHWEFRSQCLRQMVRHYEQLGVSFDRIRHLPWLNLAGILDFSRSAPVRNNSSSQSEPA